MKADKPLTYRDAGVDIDAGNELVRRIGPAVDRTRRPGVLTGIGGFGGLFEIPPGRFDQPVLVAATDGVGTKLKLAIETGRHDTIGIDLVAMCVNDVLVTGAEPLFFLDYYATSALDVDIAAAVVDGIATGCEQAGAALIGGETAEMPGIYAAGDYDLAGFCVGAVDKARIVDGKRVTPGDVLLGLASSGPHSNGYSLIRHILDSSGADPAMPIDGVALIDRLLAPTRIYVAAMRDILRRSDLHAMAHITGGGLPENLPRVLPPGTRAKIDAASWPRPAVFDWLATAGNIAPSEMLRTFNCGIGFVLVVDAGSADELAGLLEKQGETVFTIGRVEAADAPDAPSSVRVVG